MKNEKEVLLSLYKSSKESMRAHAVLLVKEGKSINEVAKLFYVDEDTGRANGMKKIKLKMRHELAHLSN